MTTHENNPVTGPVSDSEAVSGSDKVSTPESDSQSVTDASKSMPREQRYRMERNEARQRLSRLQRAEIERLASAGLSTPSDLFTLSGNQLEDYLTDDGEVDPDRVAADVEAILQERPGLKKTSPARDPSQGSGGGGGAKPKADWFSALATPR